MHDVKFSGLPASEVTKLRQEYGYNELPAEKKRTRLHHLFAQFTSPLIYILVLAGLITLLLHDAKDSIIIFAAVLVNTILGYYQEVKAENALLALKSMLSPQAKVIRDGETHTIPAKEIVPGDHVILGQGDKVPADGVLLEAVQMALNEAILTGESNGVRKNVDDTVFMGSHVISGRGVFLVKKTGLKTKMGTIAAQISSIDTSVTPLQMRLDGLARTLALLVLALSVLIMLIGLIKGVGFTEIFSTAVALAVAAIPEGMTVALTVILALGMQRILKKKALVRRMVAAETLGSVTVIATDKTGTLTEGLMRVVKDDVTDSKTAALIATYANNLEDPLEFALWQWAQEQNIDPQALSDKATREAEKTFDSVTKYMSVTIKGTTYIKGAPEILLDRAKLSAKAKETELAKIATWSDEGLRLIGLCIEKKKGNWEWIGLLGMDDPVRKNTVAVMNTCKQAGIRTMMITGDYEGTARAVWMKVQGSKTPGSVVDGKQLEKTTDAQLRELVKTTEIFARVSPTHKLRIVQALQANGEVVALVGDGVNDAPALKEANIGIVVGSASDVAKETADMVLLDSNFKTIVSAIEEGRGIYSNIRKVIRYLLSGAFAEIILVIGSMALNLPIPLTAAQILWINIVTDSLPAIALTVEPKNPHLLSRKPINPTLPLIDFEMKWIVALVSGITGLLGLFMFSYYYRTEGLAIARSVTFMAVSLGTLFYIFSLRSMTRPLIDPTRKINIALFGAVLLGVALQLVAIYVPSMRSLLQSQPLTNVHWLAVGLFTSILLLVLECTKFMFSRLHIHHR